MIIKDDKDNDNNSFTLIIILSTISTAFTFRISNLFYRFIAHANETGDL